VAVFGWDRPVAAASLLAVLVALAAWGASYLRIDFSSTGFYGSDDAQTERLRDFQARWGPDDDVLMIVVTAPTGDLLTRSRIETIGRLAGELAALPDVRRVTSVATQEIVRPGETRDDALPVWELPSIDIPANMTREDLLERLPFVPLLLSIDAKYAAIVVKLAFSSDDVMANVPALGHIQRVVDDFGGQDGLRFSVAGLPAIRATFVGLTVHDQSRLLPLALALMGAALLWVFRRAHGVTVPAAAAVLPLVLVLGLMGWTGEPIGLLNQAYFTLIPVLAVANAVHLLARYHEELLRRDRREALILAVEHTGLACTLTTATTVLAFASLGIGGMPTLRSFGLYAAAGLLFAYATVFLVLPLMLRFSAGGRPRPTLSGPIIARMGATATRWPLATVTGFVLIAVVAAGASARVGIDTRLSTLLKPGNPVREASARVNESLGGAFSLEVELTGAPGAFVDPQVVGATAAFEDWAREQPGVRAVIGPGRSLEAMALATGRILSTPDSIRSVYDELSGVIDTSDVVDGEYRRARVSIRVTEPVGLDFERFAEEVQAEATATVEPFDVRASVTGTTLVAASGVIRLTRDLLYSLLFVFVVVSVTFLVLFSSPRIMMVAVLPNALPLLIGYGMLAVLGRDMDPASGVILAFGLGVAVDDTIHLLVRIREGVRAGDALQNAVDEALAHSGRAVAITSVVISGGLAVNVLSSFPPLELLGMLGAIIMLSALMCDLLLLPALLVLFRSESAIRGRHQTA
jgi:predicted RND superfamily exporter protein